MMNFRPFSPSEIDTIKQLYTDTFSDSEGEKEGIAVGQLSYELLTTTPAEDLHCFVAENNEQLLGAVIFSRMSVAAGQCVYLLSPMAVSTQSQKQGVGQKLIRFGLNALKESGVEAVVTYGDPNYYSKIGFEPVSEQVIKAPFSLSFPHGWLAQPLAGESLPLISETPTCVEALNNAAYW